VNKSFYRILKTDIVLTSPEKELNNFFDFMLQEFCSYKFLSKADEISVIENLGVKGLYTIYKNNNVACNCGIELVDIPYLLLSKALENIVLGHAINLIDKKELITLHSGAATRNNKGILILGDSGFGKSTLTLELVANHNWLYLTDEVGLVDSRLMIHPFLKTVSCKQHCIVNIDKIWEKRFFGLDCQVSVPSSKHGHAAPLHAVIFVKYGKNYKLSIEPLRRADVIVRLMEAQIGRAKYTATIEQIAEIVKNINCYQIFHHNATDAASLITDLMDTI